MSPIVTSIYLSNCLIYHEHDTNSLGQIKSSSITRNLSLDISGALILSGDYFVGILEGSAAAIEQLMAHIARDPRHDAVKTIHQALHGERLFRNWSLAYAGKSLFVAAIVDRAVRGGESEMQQLTRMMLEFTRDSPI